MYNSYTLYQAEHVKTAREQREEDIRAGELAAEFGRLWHSLAPRRAAGSEGFCGQDGSGARRLSVRSCQARPARRRRH